MPGAAAVLLGVTLLSTPAAYAVSPHYTDGTTFAGTTNYGPPPMSPHFVADGNCTTDVIDPPTYTFITEHFVYGTTPPPAGVVPVHDDASVVVPYSRDAHGTVTVDISAEVQGKQGFRADTWNIGTGVTAWQRFDCRDPAAVEPQGHTVVPPSGPASTTTDPPQQLAVASAGGQLPFTGADTEMLLLTGVACIAVGGHLAGRYRRRARRR